ncbi:MAG: zinc-dependent alcohol dehydrogenase family protein [Candidatus Aminicenantes bacterium]|nr:zinc-dependent alcohol dehydrogenase family protein [Candidatus Aminicenantes bacterium]
MKAMVLARVGRLEEGFPPLELRDVPAPEPGPGEVLVRVAACGVCHTELDEIEGRTPPPRLPVIPGHQAVGRVERCGEDASLYKPGDRVGVAWIHSACGRCAYCLGGRENLCPEFRATGRDADGGYAEYAVVPESFALPIPDAWIDVEAAPLLCAGAIGYRSLRLTGMRSGQRLGLTGFGASGHLVLKLARHEFPASDIFVFARSEPERAFALELGARWAGATEDAPPEPLEAIIDTTPVWKPVAAALRRLAPGGRLVINAVRKENTDKEALLGLDYPADLWMEKEIKSVANVTRQDVRGFLAKAAEMGLRPEVETYALAEANVALAELKLGRIRGAKVLKIR